MKKGTPPGVLGPNYNIYPLVEFDSVFVNFGISSRIEFSWFKLVNMATNKAGNYRPNDSGFCRRLL